MIPMLKVNSKKIEPGDTFIAIKSAVRDGHDYIEDAIDRGAACIIAEHGEYSVKTVIVPDTRTYLANYLKELYADKLSNTKIIGITGTNGKTTSCYLTFQLLNELGHKAAYIGTIGFYLPNSNHPLANTTPDLYDLYEMFVEAANEECEYIVMEVSSQALDMRRLEGIKFDIIGFTNLTQDHLDYHGNMENYKNSKLILFKNLKRSGYAIINIDDKYGKDFVLENNKNILIGTKNCDYKISDIVLEDSKSTFKITESDAVEDIVLPIAGTYNIYNYMNAYVICDKLGFAHELIQEATSKLTAPAGRCQIVKNDKISVIIDYAHTPDAVLNIIKSVKEYAKGRVVTLIGCGGDRDKTKRPIMGKIATDNSDYVFFTSDNPRTEDPDEILKDIVSGLIPTNYEVISDRKEAIKKAINSLEENDILLVLGKGHEDYQIIGKDKFHLSDFEEVSKYVK
ncbi:MAG: UDP-N-acetylmuramoyl-L-alanyl-D-glutamate--2,6-diaminopimelate ligase [Bacilli bacterium]|nr:UDP-N-acetylmuramoyl-L-alanyl-D-glutamate--2,6-diaminopimelate ligase [Bacilli bacterium]